MNAYELTKELSEFMTEDKYTDLDKTIFKTCNMLRQQADELEAFKLNFYNTGYTLQLRDKDETIRQQADRIAELSKNVDELEEELLKATHPNAEPVAWVLADKKNKYIRSIMAVQHDFVPQGCVEIPLYPTPQIKELSDEEINAVYHEVWNSNKWSDVEGIDIEKFARAILKKASEK